MSDQKDIPLIYTAAMVRALLEGRKTMTRRLDVARWRNVEAGRRAWVREAHYLTDDGDHEFAIYAADDHAAREHLAQVASLGETHPSCDLSRHKKLRPSIHMPRWASRLTLIIEGVKFERLQDISASDAAAEGVEMETADPPFYYVPGIWPHSLTAVGVEQSKTPAKDSFSKLWGIIHGPGVWEKNPLVAAISFRVIKANIDSEEANG
jgi:hypothetical protein